MSIQFASGDEIRWNSGAASATGSMSWASVFRITGSNGVWMTYIQGYAAGGFVAGMGRNSGNQLSYTAITGSPDAALTHTATDNWLLAVITKASGTTVAQFYIYNFGTGTWSNGGAPTAGGGTNGQPTGTLTNLRTGLFNGTDDPFVGRQSVHAWWNTALSQANVNSLASTFTRANWLSTNPAWLADATDTFATDKSSGGTGSRTTLTGTTSSADDPAGWASWAGVVGNTYDKTGLSIVGP